MVTLAVREGTHETGLTDDFILEFELLDAICVRLCLERFNVTVHPPSALDFFCLDCTCFTVIGTDASEGTRGVQWEIRRISLVGTRASDAPGTSVSTEKFSWIWLLAASAPVGVAFVASSCACSSATILLRLYF